MFRSILLSCLILISFAFSATTAAKKTTADKKTSAKTNAAAGVKSNAASAKAANSDALTISPSKVSIGKEDGAWKMKVNGKDYYIEGVTFGISYDAKSIEHYMDWVKAMGANSIRTWGTGDETQLLLDAEAKRGITVMLGLWLRHGRVGAEGDDQFNWITDHEGRQAQWDNITNYVTKYRNHPALLMWGLGNELTLNIGPEAEKLAWAEFTGKIGAEIKKLDPNHPLSSASAWSLDWPYWRDHAPSIEVYGVNSYGPGIGAVDGELPRLGIDRPYVLTEFGVRGEWDAPSDKNGLKIEPSDKEKYDSIHPGFDNMLRKKKACLGGYVFNFGDNFDHAGNWLSFRMNGYYRPSWWATRKAFTGLDAEDPMPVITKLVLDQEQQKPGKTITLTMEYYDPDNDPCKVEFWYNRRDGSRKKRDSMIKLDWKEIGKNKYEFIVPDENGVCKLYAIVYDDFTNMSVSLTSFVPSQNAKKKIKTASGLKVSLPFVVYDERPRSDEPYIASGYMGDFQEMTIDFECADKPYKGETCMRVSWEREDGWVGCAWQDPANDWGAMPGGYNVEGASKFAFWARGEYGGEKVNIGFGIIGQDQKYFDTANSETGNIELTEEWREYSIPLGMLDLTRIKTGLKFFTASQGEGVTFYLDDIRFE